MDQKISALRQQFQADLQKVEHAREVEQLKVHYLGKKGPIQELMTSLREVAPDDRPKVGKQINDLKEELTHLCQKALDTLSSAEIAHRIGEERIDTSLPGRRRSLGKAHPLTQVLEQVLDIFKNMGFSVQYGPEIETDYYNFEGLNFPKGHPARDMQDTFYIAPEILLRTHTSNTQLRVMEQNRPPIRIVAPGTVYRNEDISTRSHVFFHQVEGLYIDKQVSFADLFATIEQFCHRLFQTEAEIRFRPSYFPFVEPGVEIDIRCISCQGKGCRLCKQSGWLEIAGAGMVHPEVLKNGGVDPEQYNGYAWGLGIERLAMLRYGIDDIRLFSENDQRFLTQF